MAVRYTEEQLNTIDKSLLILWLCRIWENMKQLRLNVGLF